MIYIFETEISNSKTVMFSLQKIYGLGKYQTNILCNKLGFAKNLKISKLSTDQIIKLVKTIENTDLVITSELRKLQIFTLKTLLAIKCYKGLRRIKGLPVRGQRTHTNAKTAKFFKRF
jgi:small subunit ribosomal protein S13|tara:strand:+ start:1240 stop:1593 length:354 start_codon:yes stop_codon:yes gene_type:complete